MPRGEKRKRWALLALTGGTTLALLWGDWPAPWPQGMGPCAPVHLAIIDLDWQVARFPGRANIDGRGARFVV